MDYFRDLFPHSLPPPHGGEGQKIDRGHCRGSLPHSLLITCKIAHFLIYEQSAFEALKGFKCKLDYSCPDNVSYKLNSLKGVM